MKVVVGLGNPGPNYETTRHNAGFLAIDWMIDEWKAKGPQRSFDAQIASAELYGEKVLLVKPQTFMNNSGKTVGPLLKFYKLEPSDLIVLHDDLDLKPITLRVKSGGGTGGHNGLKSIDAHLGTNAYHRIRIGIGKPNPHQPGPSTIDYVLQPFADAELDILVPLFAKIGAATQVLIRDGVKDAMNQFNGSQSERDQGKE